ncbi:DUF1761 domain-containing protein [Microcella sp.]|uniref:DUF1761 domain-containing protein n=1 Tax=Microcella sp. TaxID=1913979 RepID=UPI00256DBDE6|nr:DUF1761 domain-containing protein [Microcella sp.]MBX9471601.1 DUF1761 domain-containing protein [Microcella sp.]
MTDIAINPIAVGLAALAMFVLGGLWFGLLVAKPWQRLTELSDEQLKSGSLRVFGGSAILSVVIALSLSAFIGTLGAIGGLLAGFVAGLTFAAAPLVVVGLFERRRGMLLVIDAVYLVFVFAIMGLIIGAVQAA